MGFFNRKQKVLGAFLIAEKELAEADLSMVSDAAVAQFLTDYQHDGTMRIAVGVPFDAFDTPEHAMCVFIEQSDMATLITDRNSAFFLFDTTWAVSNLCFCALIKGRNDKLPSAREMFGAYLGRPVSGSGAVSEVSNTSSGGAAGAATNNVKSYKNL